MKAIVIALIVLACVYTTYAVCDANGFAQCGDTITTCLTNAGSDLTAQCICYGAFIDCAVNVGCGAEAAAYSSSCVAAGCAASV